MKKKIYIGIVILVLLLIGVYFGVSLYQNNTLPEKEYWQNEEVIKFNDNTEKIVFETNEIEPSNSYKDVEPKTFSIKNDTDRTQFFSISATNIRPVNEGEIYFDENLVNVLITDGKTNTIFQGTLGELNSMRFGEMVEIETCCKLVDGEPDCSQIVKDTAGLKENVDYVVIPSYGYERIYKPGNTTPQKIKPKKSLEYKVYIWFNEDINEGDLVVGTFNPETGEKGTAKASLDFNLTVYQIDNGLFKGVKEEKYSEKWNELVENKTVTFIAGME